MEIEQISLFGNEVNPKNKNLKNKNLKRNWENAFQRWSNSQNQNSISHYGKCGYGSMCDYCSDVSSGRPCVRAFNLMLKETGKSVDYNNRDFEDIWDGKCIKVKYVEV